MPNPKRRHSKARKNNRRAHDHSVRAGLHRVSQLPRNEAAPSRLPALRLLQGPRSDGYLGLTAALIVRHERNLLSRDSADRQAVRDDHHRCGRYGRRPRSAARSRGLGIGGARIRRTRSAGGPSCRNQTGTCPALAARASDRNGSGERSDHHERFADACFSQEKRQFRARGGAPGAAGPGGRLVSAGNTGAVMTVARFVLGTLPSVQRAALAAPFPTSRGGVSVLLDVGANVDSKVGASGAVRGDGRDLLPRDLRNAPAQSGVALDWRRRNERQRTDARSVRSAEASAAEFRWQCRRPRDFFRRRGRDRLRRIYRQRGA